MSRPVVEDTGGGGGDSSDFLKWFKGKLDGLKGWFDGVFKGEKDKDTGKRESGERTEDSKGG